MQRAFLTLVYSLFFVLNYSTAQPIVEQKGIVESAMFVGKNLATFGNSITAGQDSWAYRVARELQFANHYNGAVGGAVWSKRDRMTVGGTSIRTQDYADLKFMGISNGYMPDPDDAEYQKRINNCAVIHIQQYIHDKDQPRPDVIILSYGTNDQSTPEMLGDVIAVKEENQMRKLDQYTLAGSIKWSIMTLQDRFPKAQIYVVFPIQAESMERNNNNLKKISIIREICEQMSITYFDAFAESGITKANSAKFLRDGLHPNAKGQTLQANYIIGKLKETKGDIIDF